MQSEKYFSSLCTAASSLWCINIAEITDLQTRFPARSSEHSLASAVEDAAIKKLCFVGTVGLSL